jgi:diaminopimelate epimerase
MAIPFTKASACGNDFLILDGQQAPSDIAKFSRQICDRHNGVGADGVEWLWPARDADVEARLVNADGSDAEISGNGTRCVAAYLCSQHERDVVVVRTGAGLKTCTLMSRSGSTYEFEAAMGMPQVREESTVRTAFGDVMGIPVSMGNPHFVIFVDKFWPDWQTRAAIIQKDPLFPHGVNIELVVIRAPGTIEIRFYERGVGETQSSGTGSSAAAVASIVSHGVKSPVRVNAAGGSQWVRFEREVFLRGPAQIICRGEFFV